MKLEREGTCCSVTDRRRLHQVGVCPGIGIEHHAHVPFRRKRRRGGEKSRETQGEESAPCPRTSPTWPWSQRGKNCPLSALPSPSVGDHDDRGEHRSPFDHPCLGFYRSLCLDGHRAMGCPRFRLGFTTCRRYAPVPNFGDHGCRRNAQVRSMVGVVPATV